MVALAAAPEVTPAEAVVKNATSAEKSVTSLETVPKVVMEEVDIIKAAIVAATEEEAAGDAAARHATRVEAMDICLVSITELPMIRRIKADR